jgi:hypothetical protein
MDEVAEVLDSSCERLHTLNHAYRLDTRQIGVLLKGFSKGFREIHLNEVVDYEGEDPEWRDSRFLKALLTTASVNTIEVLKYKSSNDKDEDFVAILKRCTCMQLRVFRVE